MPNITLSDARTKLRTNVKPPNASDTVVNSRLNQVTERLIDSGKWEGTLVRIAFAVYGTGYITLPRNIGTVLAVNYNTHPAIVRPQWHSFLAGSLGEIPMGEAAVGLVDLGTGFPTFSDVSGTVYITASSSTTESGSPAISVRGLDQNGAQIRSGVSTAHVEGYPVVIGSGPSTQQVTSIYQINKPVTNGVISIYQQDVTTGAQTLIGRMDPGETNANYRRYNCDSSPRANPIVGLCKIAHVDAIADNDLIIPGNIGALKMGLLALNYEDTNDMDRANLYWNKALECLNDATKEHLGPNAGRITFSGRGYGGDGIHQLY